MAEDGIPEILAEQRLGHQVPGMRGLYAHASQRMRDELTAILQARWEESLRERATLDPYSPVPLLDSLLAPLRDYVAAMTVSAGGPELSPASLFGEESMINGRALWRWPSAHAGVAVMRRGQ
jgi:hypothetical protein